MKRIIIYCFITCLISQCKGQTKKDSKLNTISSNMENQILKFKKQEHRIEFKEEKLFYNDQHVKLDQTMAYYVSVFGDDFVTKRYETIITYNKIPISMNKGIDDQVDNIRIELFYMDQRIKNNQSDNEIGAFPPKILEDEYILIDGVPLNKDTDIDLFNEMLIDNGKGIFKQKFKGASSVRRVVLTVEKGFQEGIYIYRGELSPLAFISYSDGSTNSD